MSKSEEEPEFFNLPTALQFTLHSTAILFLREWSIKPKVRKINSVLRISIKSIFAKFSTRDLYGPTQANQKYNVSVCFPPFYFELQLNEYPHCLGTVSFYLTLIILILFVISKHLIILESINHGFDYHVFVSVHKNNIDGRQEAKQWIIRLREPPA